MGTVIMALGGGPFIWKHAVNDSFICVHLYCMYTTLWAARLEPAHDDNA